MLYEMWSAILLTVYPAKISLNRISKNSVLLYQNRTHNDGPVWVLH
jgi:hypothetical protein